MCVLMQSKNPFFSIIVPVYNTEQYLGECLDSLRAQTFDDIEIICVDDGSSDGSPAIIDAYAAEDSRFMAIHRSNGGVSNARNVGLDAASGEYVIFVDSDDFIVADSCARLHTLIRAESPDIVVFGGETFPSVEWIDRCLSPADAVYRNGVEALFEGVGSYPLMCNKAYRRSMLEAHGLRFNESLQLGEDNAFQFCAFPHASAVAYCSDSLYRYRCEREGSAMNELYANRLQKVDRHMQIVEYVLGEWQRQDLVRRHGGQLVSWIASFLYDDVQFFSFEDRRRFAARLGSLLENYSLDASTAKESEHAHARFMLDVPDMAAELPLVSVIVAIDGSCDSLQGLASLGRQYEQRIELLCACDGSSGSRALVERALGEDGRVRFAEVSFHGGGGSSIADAVGDARGNYILFANLNDRYEPEALSTMLEAAHAADADIVTIRDTTHMLRTRSLRREQMMISFPPRQSSPAGGRRKRAIASLSFADVGSKLFSHTSLAASNKLFSRKLLSQCPVDPSDFSTVARALVEASRIVALDDRLVTLLPLTGITQRATETWASGFLEGYRKLARELGDYGASKQTERGFLNAALDGMCCFLDLFRSKQKLEAAFPAVKQFVAEIVDIESHGKEWFYSSDDYEVAQLACRLSFDDFFNALHFKRLDALRKQLVQNESAVEDLDERVLEVYSSTTFKVGRAVVALPQKVLGSLRR